MSLEIKKEFNDKSGIAISLSNIGQIYFIQKKDFLTSLDYIDRALSIFEELNEKYGITISKQSIGKIYLELEKYDISFRYLNESLILAQDNQLKELEASLLELLSSLFEKQRKYKKSLKFLKKYQLLNEKLFNEHQSKIITELQTKYETENKEKEAKLFKVKNTQLNKANKKLKNEVLERKKAEEKIQEYDKSKELLLREVNHRVKNNLYTITSILNKEKDKIVKIKKHNPEEFLNDLSNRINSLSAVHSILSKTKWQPVSLDLFIDEMSNNFFNVTVKNDLDFVNKSEFSIIIDSFQAHQLALIYNEILTNSVKYSKRKLDELDIGINLSIKDKFITIIIRDNGIGFNNEILENNYTNTGIGFDLIFGIVEQSLGGSVKLSNDNGAVIIIKIKQTI